MAVVYNHDDFDRTGEDPAAVQIRIGIDEWFDEISVDPYQCGDLEFPNRALASLTRVRSALADLYDGPEASRRPLAVDENGRCGADSDHTRGRARLPHRRAGRGQGRVHGTAARIGDLTYRLGSIRDG